MSLSETTLYAYLVKCGLDEKNAKFFAIELGQNFLQLQNQSRLTGAGKNAKSFAAQGIASDFFWAACEGQEARVIRNVTSSADILKLTMLVRAAGLCLIAVDCYRECHEEWDATAKNFERFIDSAQAKAHAVGVEMPFTMATEKFREDAKRQAIASAALGKNKGFLSNVFG